MTAPSMLFERGGKSEHPRASFCRNEARNRVAGNTRPHAIAASGDARLGEVRAETPEAARPRAPLTRGACEGRVQW